MSLERILFIYYLLRFRKDNADIKALIDSGNEVNAMTLAYAPKLGLKVHHIDVGDQKIDSCPFKTFEIVLANFQVEDKLRRTWYFQETFLLADISTEIVLNMSFLTLSNANVQFVEKKLIWRSYSTAEAPPTSKRGELINKKKFAKAALDEKSKTFVIYVASLNLTLGIHLDRAAQIASLLAEEVRIPDKYLYFANVFLEKKALVLP